MTGASRLVARVIACAAAAILVAVGLVVLQPAQSSQAAISGSGWQAGNIISNQQFYDSAAMSEADIQAFLDSKIGACSNNLCLNVLVTSVASRSENPSKYTGNPPRCNAFTGGTLTAAQIIYNAQVSCGISAKVILVTLQKEQGLVTSTAPTQDQLDRAMGYNCPDTAPCAPTTLGFGNQVYSAALQFNTYKVNRVGLQVGDRYILWSPVGVCAGAYVNVQNSATAALYTYTPYQPNSAALANIFGKGDSCSTYGNRNFWVYYNTWFGPESNIPPVPTANATTGEPSSYLIATSDSGTMSMYPGNGTGGFLPAGQIGTGWDTSTAILTDGDFGGIGHPDVISRDVVGQLWMYPRDGSGGWLPRVLIGTGWNEFSAILGVGDFNGDGHPDIVARQADGTLWLYPGDGHGGFSPRVQIGSGWQGLTVVAPGDFNGDGHPDLIMRDANGLMWLYPGNGKDGFLPRVQLATGWSDYSGIVASGDFNGDGHPDLMARDGAGGLWLYPGDGKGGLLSGVQIGSGWQSFSSIVAVGNFGKTVTSPPPAAGAGAGDFNGDGHPDVVARDSAGVVWLYPGNGKGGFLPRVQLATGWQSMTAVDPVGDFNGDGHPDLVARDASGVLWLYPGNGSNGFLSRVQLASGWQSMTAIAGVANMNGDGHPDLVARDASGVLWLYPGNGAGALGAPVQIATGWSGMTAIVGVGDFNGDGHSDLVARDAAGALWLYPGDGHGALGARVQIGGGWQGLTIVAAGDLNGDGTQDLMARTAAGGLYLYGGTGHGGFLSNVQIGSGWQSFGIAGDGASLG